MSAAEEIVARHVGTRYTGAVLRVEREGRLCLERAFGNLAEEDAPVEVTTRFDLASLTKVYVATCALEAVADGVLALDEPLVTLVPTWRGTAHASITLRMLLAHTAGFASGADYRSLFDEDVVAYALARPLVAAPGERVVYSDLGFIVLGTVLERARHRSLASIVASSAAQLRLEGTTFRVRNDRACAIVATEWDAWRGRVRGSVHDEKAALMGGVSGHAGLFGTARDVARMTERFLGAVRGRPATFPRPLALAAVREWGADPVLRRGLGWALKTSDENSCGVVMDRESFGHTGFTGTCVWADPTRDLSIVFLTNAVYYGRTDLRDVRAAVCDAVMREVACVPSV